MLEKPVTYWLTLIGLGLWALLRDLASEGVKKWLVKTAASGALAIGLGEDLAPRIGFSETVTAAIIMAFGLMILDLIAAVIADRSFLKEVLKAWVVKK